MERNFTEEELLDNVNEIKRLNRIISLQVMELAALKAYVEYLEQDRKHNYAFSCRDVMLKNGPAPLAILHKVEEKLKKLIVEEAT